MKKVAFAALAVAAVAALNLPAPASAAAVTITVEYASGGTMEEPDGAFVCPENQVMTGRSHNGDENGETTYECSRILIDGVQVDVFTGDWYGYAKESRSNFAAPADQAIVGRAHFGDENGGTEYKTGALYWKGIQVRISNQKWTDPYTESDHITRAESNQIMTGRYHKGDENGKTRYQYGTVTFAG